MQAAGFKAGVDIGTRTTKVVVLERSDGVDRIVGVVEEPSLGIRAHAIVGLEEVAGVVDRVLARAEQCAGAPIDDVVCAVSGRHVELHATVGVTRVRSGIVSPADLDHVQRSARDGVLGPERSELHLLVHHYCVGASDEVTDPVGMHGRRLEAWGRIVSAEQTLLRNYERCFLRAGRGTPAFALGPLAAADALLSEEERDGSVCLVDIGASGTEVVAFAGGAPVHRAVVALGGDHLTQDLVDMLRTPFSAAERLKREHGSLAGTYRREERIDVPGFGDALPRSIERRVVGEAMLPRVEELFELVRRDLERAGAPLDPQFGFVLCGGGALLDGIDEFAAEILGANVRLASACLDPEGAPLADDPRFAVALGLARGRHGTRRPRSLSGRFRDWIADSF